MTNFLGSAYLWVKAAHVIFMVFWMAGLFILPRYLVHHQEGLDDPAERPRWVSREAKLRAMILTPAMVAVWLLGLALAANAGLFDGQPGLGWLHAKLLFVLLLTGYHGWAVGYAKKLAAGRPTLASSRLRMLNEVPALLLAVIVALAIVKPF
ncbi:CopD family protein [Sphingomonas desiccabilis]|uniref:Protoporphyrinogen IX oxidase n=1 Tax=Sphingomonas desiccabilis TaxID=429134 RepID=A0A4Q2IQ89_9SPHN|nr:CopD family protein [Sphingomonas desiccabilis]MBB3912182.1 putative membrane protein [Sphingomonas desiccabilis]RXZ30342.1 CopD family protein [Sphingomonas desiccabilis]